MGIESLIALGVVLVLFIVLLIINKYWVGLNLTVIAGTVWSSEAGKHTLLVLGLILVFQFGIQNYSQHGAEEKASEWLTSYNGSATTNVVGPIKASLPGLIPKSAPSPPAGSKPDPSPTPGPSPEPTRPGLPGSATAANSTDNSSPVPSPTPTQAEQIRLDAQLRTIRDRTKHHADVMAYFYVNYFVAITMVMCAGLIIAITLFFIAQGGWKGTNPYVRTIFIVMSATAAFYGLFPPVFEQQKNIADNKQLFLQYKSLESEVQSYPVTHTTIKNEIKTPREFINYIDADMDRLGNIALGFDITKITYQEAIDVGKRPVSSPTPPVNSTSNANSSQ